MSSSSPPRVSLTINAGLGDVRHFEQVLRHDVRALDYPFFETVITYDCSQPEGRMSAAGGPDELRAIMRGLVAAKVVDRADEVPWDETYPEVLRGLGMKYFATPDLPARSRGGTPIYQFLYALDRCRGDYVLHLDADILFYHAPGSSWISEGIEFLHRHRGEAMMVCPPAGPPRARTLLDLLRTRRIRQQVPGERWHRSGGVSTRYYLADWKSLCALAPWVRVEHDELLEASLSHTFRERGVGRWTMNGSDCYAVHIHRRTAGFYAHRDELIRAVENNVYPLLRTGHSWDMRTDRLGLVPWLLAIRLARFHRRFGKVVGRPS